MIYHHQILIDDASGTDVEVSRLGVAHLSIWQTHGLARSLQLGVRISGFQIVEIWRWGLCYHVTLALVAYAPAVENDQKSFLWAAKMMNSFFMFVGII